VSRFRNALLLCAAVITVTPLASCSSSDSPTAPVVPSAGNPYAPVAHDGLAASTAEAEGISKTALDQLVADAIDQKSDALVVLRNGKIIYESYFGTDSGPIVAMSASKSFVSLAYGFMLADQSLASLDVPVVKFDPAFADVDPRKAGVTIRQLLSQTSGIGPWRASDVGGGNDIMAYANRSPLIFAPGTGWQYSNNGVDFLSALSSSITGRRLDTYLYDKLFTPIGVPGTGTAWHYDANGAPYGAGGIGIRPIDMAKVGQVILSGGTWNGKQIIDPNWIAQSEAISSPYNGQYGLLWWRMAPTIDFTLTNDLLDQWEGNGIATSLTAKLRAAAGTSEPTWPDFSAFLRSLVTSDDIATINNAIATLDHFPPARIEDVGPATGFYFSGSLGQYMYFVPAKNLVAVRMRRETAADAALMSSTTELNGFPLFFADVDRLVP
jgi:CubicO group peptidase (beta-lactamase class C family)